MRKADCKNGVCVKIVVEESTSSDESYHLTIFDKVLATLVSDYSHENEVAERDFCCLISLALRLIL